MSLLGGASSLIAQAGRKKQLAESAVYPVGFGLAVGGLIGSRTEVPTRNLPLNINYKGVGDDLGAIDDLLKGPKKAWWRKLK